MGRMLVQTARISVLALVVMACTSPVESRDLGSLTPRDNHALFITLTKPSWTWEEVSSGGIQATVTNGSDRPLASTLGDRFNSATEQPNLYVALGGSSAVEWLDSGGIWREMGLAHLVEGVKQITLRPAGNYALTALLREPRRSGTFRIRVDFADFPSGGNRLSDYSGVFEIR
ncbi:MAG TPA: hypothetical protein VJ717_05530 [Gemmatimonadaceae bacterium]|nr:hypothetical protein [Gemmatimonadaceae bacterium]